MKRSDTLKISHSRSVRPVRLPIAVLLWLVVLAACSSPPPADATGSELFNDLCSACHGARLEGKVGPPLGQGAPSATLPDDYLETSIRKGIGTMPSFDHLSEAQLSRLVAYIREVQAGG